MKPAIDPTALPMQVRVAPIGAVDNQQRVIEVCFSTGAVVHRRRWVGWDTLVPFEEELVVSRDAINLERLEAGAPALDSHSMWSTYSQVGVTERPRIADGKAFAFIRFPTPETDEAADRMFGMVDQRIIRNVSVGYSIDEVEVTPAGDGKIERHKITRWTPHEISFVTIPADKGAQVRGADQLDTYPCRIMRAPAAATAALARMRMRQAQL
ncbi:MAG: hypothetical protein ACK4UO_06180 [Pseudolabrys sp.]